MIITPSTIKSYQKQIFPEVASEILNRLIASKWNGYSSSFKHKDFLTLLKAADVVENSIEHNLSLNFRNVYCDAGWNIETEYDCNRELHYSFLKRKLND